MKEIILISAIGLILAVGIILLKRKENQAKESLPDDIPADNEHIFVEYKGTVICMTYLEKQDWWDHMNRQEKRHQVDVTNRAVADGKLVGVKYEGKIACVNPNLAKQMGWEIISIKHKKLLR